MERVIVQPTFRYEIEQEGKEGKGNEKWTSQIEIPNAPVLLYVCACKQPPWECWRSECQDVDPYVLSMVQWWSESEGILPCDGKQRPADGSFAPINHHHCLQPLTLNVLAPTQSDTYVPFFHHAIISRFVPYPGLESKEQTHQTATSTQPPFSTMLHYTVQPLHSNNFFFPILK